MTYPITFSQSEDAAYRMAAAESCVDLYTWIRQTLNAAARKNERRQGYEEFRLREERRKAGLCRECGDPRYDDGIKWIWERCSACIAGRSSCLDCGIGLSLMPKTVEAPVRCHRCERKRKDRAVLAWGMGSDILGEDAASAEPEKEEPCPPPRPSLWTVTPVFLEQETHWQVDYDGREERTFFSIREVHNFLYEVLHRGYGIAEGNRMISKLINGAVAEEWWQKLPVETT